VLALAHARSGDAVAIGAYLGRSDAFERALMRFAAAYADDLLRGTGPDSRWGTLADVR
jgi:hypothetical protein